MANADKESAFDTIEQFVNSLTLIYKDDKPLIIFNEFVKKIRNNEFGDKTASYKDLTLTAFNKFYTEHKQKISAGTIGELPRGACITVTSGMKLNIPKYYIDADDKDRSTIAKTLLTAGCLLNPEDNDAFKLLEDFENKFKELNCNNNTKEGAFVNSIVNMALGSIQNIDPNNPGANLAAIGNSLPGMISEFQKGMEGEELDTKKMISGFQDMIGTFSALLPQGEMSKNVQETADFITNNTGSGDNTGDNNGKGDADFPSVPTAPSPRANAIDSEGNLNPMGMMQMAMGMMNQSANQSAPDTDDIGEVEAAATQSAMMSSMAKTVGDTVFSAFDAINDN